MVFGFRFSSFLMYICTVSVNALFISWRHRCSLKFASRENSSLEGNANKMQLTVCWPLRLRRLLITFASFGVAFLARPFGALLVHAGGRMSTKIFTLVVMSLETGAIGFLPTYAQIEVLAPVPSYQSGADIGQQTFDGRDRIGRNRSHIGAADL
jgi:hypothetical protein